MQINLPVMKITNEIKNTLDGVNDSSDITEENINELEGNAKDYPKWHTQRKSIHKHEKVASISHETTSSGLIYA